MNLIEKFGHDKLLSNVTIGHIEEAHDLIYDMVKDNAEHGGVMWAAY